MKKEKLVYKKNGAKICVNVDGYNISYKMRDKNNYTLGSFGAASMREYLENIENEENSTHYLKLDESDWETVIHGFVPFEFYKITNEEEMETTFVMRMKFTGQGTSPTRVFKEPETREVLLGRLFISDTELKLVTDDGEEHIYVK